MCVCFFLVGGGLLFFCLMWVVCGFLLCFFCGFCWLFVGFVVVCFCYLCVSFVCVCVSTSVPKRK